MTTIAAIVLALTQAFTARQDVGLIRGAGIVVMQDGEIQTMHLGDAANDHSRFELGSISKSFAGVALAMAVNDRLVDLDKPISEYVPELSGTFVGTVTARELATHSAGLGMSYMSPAGVQTDHDSEADLIAFLRGYQQVYPLGQRQYSNLGFHTLALVLSRVRGKPYSSLVREEILQPLGMGETDFITSAVRPTLLLQGYAVTLDPWTYDWFSDLACGAGGVYSDIFDMTKYLVANSHPDESPLGQAMALSHVEGLGWDSHPGETPVWKNGAMVAGFSTYMGFDPASGSGTVVLTNVLDLTVTMGLGQIAMGGQDDSLPAEAFTSFSVDTLVAFDGGKYVSADGRLGLNFHAMPGGFLKIDEVTDGVPLPVRLLNYRAGVALVNNGPGIDDIVVYDVKSPAKLTYKEFMNQWDEKGQPVFQDILFTRQ